MKVINGEHATMGRLASYAAKQALKGEDIVIVNCEKVIITGSKSSVKADFQEKRTRVGSGQQGPKISRLPERVVKRAIRGMLPNHRFGRGKEAFARIRCYQGIPAEYEKASMIRGGKEKGVKFISVEEMTR